MSESVYSPAYLRAGLEARHLAMQKKFGQNFLISEAVCDKITDASLSLSSPDAVCLEIGPGVGALTQKLCKRFFHVCAIEIDNGMVAWLEDTMRGYENFTLIHADALKTDLSALIKPFSPRPVCVCANIPYDVTSPLLSMLVESELCFDSITLMIQKEAANRLSARPGDPAYGSMCAYLAYYGTVKKLFDVKSANFYPEPSIVSTVIAILPHREKPVTPLDEALFFKVVRAAFSSRRKTLLNCLSSAFSLSKTELADILESAQISPAVRGEVLGLKEFCAISDALYEHINP